jgi:hypothetical protein
MHRIMTRSQQMTSLDLKAKLKLNYKIGSGECISGRLKGVKLKLLEKSLHLSTVPLLLAIPTCMSNFSLNNIIIWILFQNSITCIYWSFLNQNKDIWETWQKILLSVLIQKPRIGQLLNECILFRSFVKGKTVNIPIFGDTSMNRVVFIEKTG